MEIWREEAARWWTESTQAERLAVVAAIQAWAKDVGQEWDLDPHGSRQMYVVLGRELASRYGEEMTPDKQMVSSWYQLPGQIQASWVRVVGEQLAPEGAEAARVVSVAVDPPPFRNLAGPEQVDLLRQIAGEIEQNLELDPRWYSSQTPAFRQLARSIRHLEEATKPPEGEQCQVWWSHLNPPARHKLLGELGEFARWAARGEEVRPAVRQELMDLARSAEQIIAPGRSLPLARE